MAEQVQLDIDLANVRKELADLRAELANVRKDSDAAFSGVSGDVKELAKEMQDLVAVENQVADSARKTNAASGGLFSQIRTGIANLQVGGKSLSEWQGQLTGLIGKLSSGTVEAGRFAGVFRVLSNVFKASGIGLVITAVAGLISYFVKFQSIGEKVNNVMAALSATLNVITDRLASFGSALVNAFSGNFVGAAQDLTKAVSGLGGAIYDAAVNAYNLEQQFQDLQKASVTAGVEMARQQVTLQKYKSIIDDGTQSLGRRAAAAQKAGAIETDIANKQFDTALQTLDLERQKFNLSSKGAEDRQRLADAEKSFLEAQAAREKTIYDIEKQGREFRKEAADERKKQLSDEAKALDKLKSDLEKLRVEGQADGLDKDLAALNKKYDDLVAVAQKGIAKLNEIEKRRALSPQELAQRQEFADLTVQIEERRLDAIVGLVSEYNEKELQLEEEQAKRRKDLAEQEQKAALDAINGQKAIREQQLKQGEAAAEAYLLRLRQQGATEKEIAATKQEFDLLTQSARLKSEIDFQEKILSVVGDGDKNRADQIKATIATLKAELENVNFQIDNPKNGQKPFDLFQLLGLDPNDPNFDDQKKAIESAFSDIIKGLEKVAAARVEAAKVAVESADRQVKTAEDALDREIEIAQLGFASNVDLKRQELAEAKKQREKALEEQKKAQRQQLALDSIQQASNIAVSSTNLIKSWSTLPFGVGLILAFAQVAQIVAFMAGVRARAKAISNQQFRQGGQAEITGDGFIAGPSHEGGGVVPELEGGEFLYSDGRKMAVVKRSATAAHFGLLRAINDDDRPRMRAYLERLTGGVSRDSMATSGAASTANGYSAGGGTDLLRENNRLAGENNRLTKRLVELEERRAREGEYIDLGDRIKHVKGGRVTFIQKTGR